MSITSRTRTAAQAAALAVAVDRALRRRLAADGRWQRLNYRDVPVPLSGGPAVAAGALVATAACRAPAALLVGAAAAGLGLYDDLYGDTHARGLRGHARALREGRWTTGMVKLVGMAGAAAGVAWWGRRRLSPALADAALIAGTANLANLLDLRPGRALKALGVAAGLASALDAEAGSVATAAAAAAVATLPADLGEKTMIGDCGANGLGALLGWSLATGLGPRGRGTALAAVVGLTLASERVSFSTVIEDTPWLARLDAWGRR